MELLSMSGCKKKFAVVAIFMTLCFSVCTGSQTEHVVWKTRRRFNIRSWDPNPGLDHQGRGDGLHTRQHAVHVRYQ